MHHILSNCSSHSKQSNVNSLNEQTSNSWSLIEKGPREKFTTVAIYKGNFVAVKKVNKRTVELSRNVLMELKQVHLLHNFISLIFISSNSIKKVRIIHVFFNSVFYIFKLSIELILYDIFTKRCLFYT